MKVYVLHENDEWLPPFRDAFASEGVPFEEWHLARGELAFDEAPPDGVFYSRMSASAHTRGHEHAPALAGHVLRWLEMYGRRVVNGSRTLALEVSKIAQYAALKKDGITVPRTRAAIGKAQVEAAAEAFDETPFILKPNRGGKGLGVQLFHDLESLATYLDGPDYDEPVDGTWLIQEYVQGAGHFIVRAEFIGGAFHYAVKVDASDGFELCPADVCAIGDQFCPAAADDGSGTEPQKFEVLKDFSDPLIDRIGRVLAAHGAEVAGVEFVRDGYGQPHVYDINTNTNYNAAAERTAGIEETAPQRLARFLSAELARVRDLAEAA